MRYMPAIQEMKRLIDSGYIGRPITARASRTRWAEMHGQADWWKMKRPLTGGMLLHELHELDALLFLLGDVDSVYGQVTNLAHPYLPDYDDVVQTMLRFRNGTLATLEMGFAHHEDVWGISINGSEAALVLDFHESMLYAVKRGVKTALREAYDDKEANLSLRDVREQRIKGTPAHNTKNSPPAPWMARMAEAEMAHFADCICGRSQPLVPGQDGRRSVVVAEAIMESVRRRAAVSPV
jgi:UDP-N-acetyl-2-amino-2-deoxyglucuronate dehydrogenase